ncbi:hypothetical protein [Chryseobacterium echinoideorum]|uniref:hypothetical protein n=1 Tax=Chryseobacterium echinoideorum TaxID=1549648 RepID=UPI0011871AB6|nr:hypothetical protein [Chryseobacterium echinoideorum]
MVTPNSSSKTVILSEFSRERNDLYFSASSRISDNLTDTINYDIHKNYKLEIALIDERLQAITNKFRKCEMIYHLYFDELDHDLLTSTTANLPISSHRFFQSSDGEIKQYFEVDTRVLYQELIDYQFQNIILFTSSILENLVYLSETLVKKVSIHTKKNKPQSITMENFIELLGYLQRLKYRIDTDPISSCLQTHTIFLTRYLPTISIFRNRFIHGYAKNLFSDGYEYKLSNVELPLTSASPDLSVSEFTKNIIENLKRLIPEFFTAITTKINASTDLPA